jgi:hypothetical protein
MSKGRGEQPACDEVSRVEPLTFEHLKLCADYFYGRAEYL